MPRYFFHTADGQRTIDHVGAVFDTEADARLELIQRAGRWLDRAPHTLIKSSECRVEMTLADLKPIFSIMMFTTDPRSFGQGR